MKRMIAILAAACVCAAAAGQNASRTFEERADEILSKLTLKEKAALMMNESPAIERLGIKQYNWWNEALHGVGRNGSATVFPQPIGMAASFNPTLLRTVFDSVSDEARVKNRIAASQGPVNIYQGLTFWTPNINIFRDPRWGRGMETYGEDPYLTSVMGTAVVCGLQGDPSDPEKKVHACAKHFAVHSGPESTRHSYNAEIGERDLRETYLPAFKALVDADVQEFMIAYNRFRGEPCGASDYLVNTILRGEWGYKGIITSDCWAVADFYVQGRHGYSVDAAEAVAAAVKNGVDTECGDAYRHIPEAVERGLLTEADIDKCLRRLLIDRFELGEMDGISKWDNLPDDIVECDAHKQLSLEMARESLVLLQNRGNVLPLTAGAGIALVGPNADDAEMMWGNYNAIPKSTITLRKALEKRIPGLQYIKGCEIYDGNEAEWGAMHLSLLQQLEGVGTVIFAGGISPRVEGEEMPVSIEGFAGGDRTSLELPRVQRALIEALHLAGKKVILVNFSGSAMGLVPEVGNCDAILQAWYPGQMGGEAIADVLLGDYAPVGRLPVTFYKSVDQLPDFEDYDMEGHTYRYFRGEPLFEFGYGLTYTTFKYGRASIRNGKVVVPVSNTGSRDASETVQLYLSRPSDKQGPIKTLRGFTRVFVPAGATVNAEFELSDDMFVWWNDAEQDMTVLPGRYIIKVGGSSRESALKSLKYQKAATR